MTELKDLAFLDATALAELMRQKEVRVSDLLEATVERIERLNPSLNAVVTPMYDEARAYISKELPDGPFAGVPFLLKDLLALYGGVRMTAGATLLKDFVPGYDSELVVRLKRAGLVILGKTNTPEFGLIATTEPRLFGPCHNPWDLDRTTGGSSGGSAAAVAAGLVPIAHGNDGGGSIRIPASCCGVFGLKPTRGRNPLGPDRGDILSGLVVEHAITRSVRDSAALLDATSGPDIGDPYWAPPPKRPFIEEVTIDPGKLRIAFSTEAAIEVEVHKDCVEAVHNAAQLCSELGHEVTQTAPKVENAMDVQTSFLVLWTAGVASNLDFITKSTGQEVKPEMVEPLTWNLYETGRQYTASDYILAVGFLQRLSREIARFFVDYDIWLTPTLAEPPVPLGTFEPPADNPWMGIIRTAMFAPFTQICNITGQPAMSVPLYWNAAGLPIGTHFIGRFGDEATLFRLGAQLEEARPWKERRPPIAL